MTSRALVVAACVLAFADSARATSVVLPTLPPGSSFRQAVHEFRSLDGTTLDGQTQDVDLRFENFLVVTDFSIILQLYLSPDIPSPQIFEVTGYLTDEAGLPIGNPFTLPQTDWFSSPQDHFSLTGFSVDFRATRVGLPPPGTSGTYEILPFIFSGVRLQFAYPEGQGTVIGGFLIFFAGGAPEPFYVAPNPVPRSFTYYAVPETGSTGMLLAGVVTLLLAWRRWFPN
jgi:hypothetical protein